MYSHLLQFAAEETAEKTGIAVLGINPVSFLLQLITFVILFLILKKFAFESIIGVLEQRRKTIDAGVRLGEKLTQEKEKLEEEVAQALQEARKKADRIIVDAHHEAGVIIKEAENRASSKVDTMLKDAQAKIVEDIEKARKNLESEVLVLIAEAAEAVLQEKIDPKKDSALLVKSLQGVKK